MITPQKCGDVYLYDLLPSTPTSTASCSSFANSRINSPGPYMNQSMISSLSFDADCYDIPKPAVPVVNENHRFRNALSRQSILSTSSTANSLLLRMDDSSYDVPRPASNLGNSRMTPSSSNSSLLTSDSLSLSLSSSNRSSLANMPDYDVPRKHLSNKRTPPPQSQSILSLKSVDLGSENYDVPSPHANMNSPKRFEPAKELPLELSSALDTLTRLQNEATVGVTKLLSFVNPQWRIREKLEPVLMDVKLAVVRLKTSLHDLAEFAEGALGNAMKIDDKSKGFLIESRLCFN